MTLLGYKFSDKYRYRSKVFEKLCLHNSLMISEIGVTNPTVENQIKELKISIPETLQGCEKFLEGERFVCRDKRLSLNQRDLVGNYINSLGTSDVDGQRSLLSSFGERLNSEYLNTKKQSADFSGLSLRLGFSLGLAIMIVVF